MKKILFTISLLVGCAHGSFHAENDFFNPFEKNSDKYFTHGTRGTYEDDGESFSIGQNIYTPSKKRPNADIEELKKDRPYTGWLYGEYRKTYNETPDLQTIYGIQLGCAGPCSYARQTQSEIHRFLDQHVPTWDRNFSLKSEPGFILEWEKYKDWYVRDHAISRIYGLGKFGNIINSGAIGIDVRVGRGVVTPLSTPIVFKGPLQEKDSWTIYAFLKLEERFVPYNHFLDGSLFQNERHTVESVPLVSEGNLGFSLGYEDFIFTYTYIIFSNEWEERKGSFAFGGVDFKW